MNISYAQVQKIAFLIVLSSICTGVHAQTAERSYIIKTASAAKAGQTMTVGALVKIRARSDKKIMLNWAPFQEGVSHYILERSGDGRNYEEACVFFTGEWGTEPEYVYTDNLRKSYTGTLFYRLRVVYLDGTELYTAASISETQRP